MKKIGEMRMDVILLIGGLAFFLFGMNVMSDGLRKMAGGSLERSLKKSRTTAGWPCCSAS